MTFLSTVLVFQPLKPDLKSSLRNLNAPLRDDIASETHYKLAQAIVKMQGGSLKQLSLDNDGIKMFHLMLPLHNPDVLAEMTNKAREEAIWSLVQKDIEFFRPITADDLEFTPLEEDLRNSGELMPAPQ